MHLPVGTPPRLPTRVSTSAPWDLTGTLLPTQPDPGVLACPCSQAEAVLAGGSPGQERAPSRQAVKWAVRAGGRTAQLNRWRWACPPALSGLFLVTARGPQEPPSSAPPGEGTTASPHTPTRPRPRSPRGARMRAQPAARGRGAARRCGRGSGGRWSPRWESQPLPRFPAPTPHRLLPLRSGRSPDSAGTSLGRSARREGGTRWASLPGRPSRRVQRNRPAPSPVAVAAATA